MEKIDYVDINKFLVSLGVVLIGLSVLTPYLYLKEDFGLYIEMEKFEKLQEPVKNLILSKQSQVSKIQPLILWISLGQFAAGLTSLIIGLTRWFRRQAKLDEKFDKELEKLNLEIVALTPEEKEEKAKQEVQEIEKIEQTKTTKRKVAPTSHSEYVQSYMRIEQNVADVFTNYQTLNFEILPQQKIGNRYEIDILLRAKSKKYLDRIVEIKYFRNRLPLQIIRDIVNRLNTQISYYNQASNRRSVPVLLVVYNKEMITADDILKFQNRIFDECQDIPHLERLKIEFIEESDIQDFNVRRIIKK